MEHENTLETVARMMNSLRPVGCGTYTLLAVNHQLSLTNKKDLPPDCTVLAQFGPRMINDGLLAREWDYVHYKLLELIQKGELR